jgi:hypothetical protein
MKKNGNIWTSEKMGIYGHQRKWEYMDIRENGNIWTSEKREEISTYRDLLRDISSVSVINCRRLQNWDQLPSCTQFKVERHFSSEYLNKRLNSTWYSNITN